MISESSCKIVNNKIIKRNMTHFHIIKFFTDYNFTKKKKKFKNISKNKDTDENEAR